MWNITSNNVQRAKERLQLRRAEIETRYAEEKKALDAEFAVIETLERAASEFMLKLNRENGAIPSEPTAPTDPPGGDEQDNNVAIVAEPSQPAAPIDVPGGVNSAAASRGSLRSPPRSADQVVSSAAKSAAVWTFSNPDRAGGSTAAIVRPIPKASPATFPPPQAESPSPDAGASGLRSGMTGSPIECLRRRYLRPGCDEQQLIAPTMRRYCTCGGFRR